MLSTGQQLLAYHWWGPLGGAASLALGKDALLSLPANVGIDVIDALADLQATGNLLVPREALVDLEALSGLEPPDDVHELCVVLEALHQSGERSLARNGVAEEVELQEAVVVLDRAQDGLRALVGDLQLGWLAAAADRGFRRAGKDSRARRGDRGYLVVGQVQGSDGAVHLEHLGDSNRSG